MVLAVPAHAQLVRAGVEAYERGDFATALREWRPLAESGNAIAQAGVGLMFARGQGVARDDREALKWIRLSVEQEHPFGQNILGDMYRNGQGVRQDFATAALYYELSAAQEYAPAQYNLGFMYENGSGVRRDLIEAYKWYTLAAEQGHPGAQRAREAIGEALSTDDRQDAMARVQQAQGQPTPAAPEPSKPISLVPPQNAATPAEPPIEQPGEPPSAESAKRPAASPAPAPDDPLVTAPQSPSAATTMIDGGWRVQLISLRDRTRVEEFWATTQQSNHDLLDGLTPQVEMAELSDGTFYRLRAGPLSDHAAAISLCASMLSRAHECLVIAPQ